ncbi:MAG: S-layer homology domain-containing protein [Clostridia bacterium]|nr:S-layer homology domain-containing protein [Clostridia bacterium]
MLLCVMFVGILPLGVSAVNTDQVTLNMTNLKAATYPDGWYWCGGDPYKSISYSGCGKKTTCLCNNFNNAYQCHGFALIMAQRTVGSFPAIRLAGYRHGVTSNGWTVYTSVGIGKPALCAMGLRPGDIVRASARSDFSDGHTAIVWKVEDGKVYFAECWGHVYSKIHWGSFNGAHTSMESICAAYTYVALVRNSSVQIGTGACPHSYREGHEGTHPHRKYTACIYCQDTKYTGEYATVSNCVCCKGVHDYAVSNEEVHPHKETKTCRMCGYFAYTGKTAVKADCPICQGIPYDLNISFEKDSYFAGETVKLEFSAQNAARYRVVVKKDGVKLAEYNNITDTSAIFDTEGVGNYIAAVTAYADDGKSVSADSAVLSVKAPITDVTVEENIYYITYGLRLDEESALSFCEERGLVLSTYTDVFFTAAFETDKLESEYMSENLYTYFPIPLSYYEAVDFAKCMGGILASSDSPETQAVLVKLCDETVSDGIILGSRDSASEGIWITEENRALEYFNWNISYIGGADRYKNCLFMYPGGTVTDSYEMPSDPHGFVVKSYSPFEYIDNGDDTLTLFVVEAIESSNLEIPAEHNGMPVVAIHSDAFARGVYGEIFIPSSITHIDPGVFAYADIRGLCVERDSEIHKLLIEYQVNEEIPIRFVFPFNDVSEKAWYYEGVRYCYDNSYISGTSKNTFSPNSNVTREQFVMMLANIAGADLSLYADTDTGMSDVPVGKWYSSAVAWAVSEGYVSGVAEGVFGLGQNITREQLARLLYLYAEKQGVDTGLRADLTVYTDESTVSVWAYDNVSWAVAAGLISGMSADTLGARGTATRAQAARIFMMFDRVTTLYP